MFSLYVFPAKVSRQYFSIIHITSQLHRTPSPPLINLYHLSQFSSSFFSTPPIPPPPPALLIALVPTAALGPRFPASAKLSQKSFLLSSIGVVLYAPLVDEEPSLPSTKRLKPSAALFAPVWAPRATWAAVSRAWAARSVSANCVNSQRHQYMSRTLNWIGLNG